MEEKKLKRIVSLVTVAVIVIFFAMLIGLVFQFVSIAKLKAEKNALDEKISYYTTENCKAQNYKGEHNEQNNLACAIFYVVIFF